MHIVFFLTILCFDFNSIKITNMVNFAGFRASAQCVKEEWRFNDEFR